MTHITSEAGVQLHTYTRGSIACAFSQRQGGVSCGHLSSLNIGLNVSDDVLAVRENERRIAYALGGEDALKFPIIRPTQVHGSKLVILKSASDYERVQAEAEQGCDAVVVLDRGVSVLLAFADCVPVIILAKDGFAVIHSGWKGTVSHISVLAAQALCDACHISPQELDVVIGPHIGGADYEVSDELLDRFCDTFGEVARAGRRHLSLGSCIKKDLIDFGILPQNIEDSLPSTASSTDLFYSHRAEGGYTGRHAAFAYMK